MVNTSRRWKLEYTDNNGNTQIIAEAFQNTGALAIERHVHIRRKNDPDMLKVWLEGENFGNEIPTRKSEFGTSSNGTNEPEIRYKQYNPETGSFELKNRFYPKNKGTIDENGNLAWKLYSFMRYTGQQPSQTVDVSSDTEAALNSVLPQGYVAKIPGDVSAPGVDNYTLSKNGEADREKGYYELSRNYSYALTFTGNIDSNGDAEVKYEPVGYGGTVTTLIPNSQASSHQITGVDTGNNVFKVNGDVTSEMAVDQEIEVIQSTGNNGTYTIKDLSFDSSNNQTNIEVKDNITDSTADGTIIPGGQAIFKTWEKEKTDEIINKVRVEATNTDGDKVTGTAENSTIKNEYGERFKKIKIGYVQNNNEADSIAENFLQPGLKNDGTDKTEIPESGTLKTSVFSNNIVNDSVQVVDNTRNIDDTFTVVQQRNYWPEASTELELEFEKENLERAATGRENLRDERSRLYPGSQQDVGGQNIDTQNSYTQTANADVSTSEQSKSPDTNGSTGFPIAEGQYEYRETGATVSDNSSISVSDNAPDLSTNFTEYLLISVNVSFNGSAGDIDVIIENKSSNNQYFFEEISLVQNSTARTITIIEREITDGDQIETTVENETGSAAEISIDQTLDALGFHDHSTSGNTDSHDHNVGASDAGHGGTNDSSTHRLEGRTEDGQNINTATEEKTDR